MHTKQSGGVRQKARQSVKFEDLLLTLDAEILVATNHRLY